MLRITNSILAIVFSLVINLKQKYIYDCASFTDADDVPSKY